MEDILRALVGLIVSVAMVVLIPYIKSKLTAEQQERIMRLIRIAVDAAEQTIKGQQRGAEKKAAVVEMLGNQGVRHDAKTDAMIEAAVFELNSAK